MRTDIHRPSAAEFDPQAYELIGCFDLHVDEGDRRAFAAEVNAQAKLGNTFHGAPHGTGQCNHCGTHIRYAALMLHVATKTLLTVGEQCLDNRFDLTKAQFQSLRKQAKLNAERRETRKRYEELCEEHPALVWATYAHNIGEVGSVYEEDEYDGGRYRKPGTSWEERARAGRAISIMSEIADKARRYGSLSDAQAALLERLVDQLTEKDERLAQWEAERAAEQATASPAPSGRVTVTGTVLKTEWRNNPYGPGGSVKMLVKTDAGWRCWCTMPANLDDGPGRDETGRRVEFVATVQPSADDQYFAFGKRPARARWLD